MTSGEIKRFLIMRPVYWPLSLVAATILAGKIAGAIGDNSMSRYVAEYPHDGQDGLGAFMDAIGAFVLLWPMILAVCILAFEALRKSSGIRND